MPWYRGTYVAPYVDLHSFDEWADARWTPSPYHSSFGSLAGRGFYVREGKGWDNTEELDGAASPRRAAPGQALVCVERRHRRQWDRARRSTRWALRRSRHGRSAGRAASHRTFSVRGLMALKVTVLSSQASAASWDQTRWITTGGISVLQ